MQHLHTIAFGWPGGTELIVVLAIGLLLFGRRLPEIARSLGKSIVEFKKGVREVKDDISAQSNLDSAPTAKLQKEEDTASASAPPPATASTPEPSDKESSPS